MQNFVIHNVSNFVVILLTMILQLLYFASFEKEVHVLHNTL